MKKVVDVIFALILGTSLFILGFFVGHEASRNKHQPPQKVFLENINDVRYTTGMNGQISYLTVSGINPKTLQLYNKYCGNFENEAKIFYDLEKDKPQFAKGLKTYWGLKDFEVHLHKLEDNKNEK